MIIDALLQFSALQAVTASAPSTNSVDLGIGKHGVGEQLIVAVGLASAMVGAGTIAVTAEFADDVAFTSNVESFSIGSFAAASPAGAKAFQHLPITKLKQRFFRLFYTVTGVVSASSFNAAIVKDVDAYEAYADAFTIS